MELDKVGGVILPCHDFEESSKVLVVHHVVEEASLHDSTLDIFLWDGLDLPTPVDPVTFDNIS